MTNMKDTNAERWLDQCQDRDNVNPDNIDPVPTECGDDKWPSQKRVARNPPDAWTVNKTFKKSGPPAQAAIGQHALCDPIQTGQIVNDPDTPNREVIYRYSRGIRGCDEAMTDMFRQVIVIDEQGKNHQVPIIWASQEKAVAWILSDNTRKDNSLVVDRIRLPIMAIWNTGIAKDDSRFTYQKAYSLLPWLDPEGIGGFHLQEKYPRDTYFGVTRGIPLNISYTLFIWTMYQEDLNQILEQCISKFSPVGYLRIRGVWWEVIVTLDGLQNNIELEPGENKLRIMKYQLNMTAKTYLPQPIYRLKELPPNICDTPDPLSQEEVQWMIKNLEEKIKDLEGMNAK